jgi:hypothetical protein
MRSIATRQASIVNCQSAISALASFAVALPAVAQDLPEYFGFDPLEIVKIDRGAGPIELADMDGDGLLDLLAVNNFKSRIEIHYQKKNASPEDEPTAPVRTNEFPEHWRFRREFITVSHRVGALVPHDCDEDGLMDLVYAGDPAELVIVRQTSPGSFAVDRRHPVKGLHTGKDSLRLADVVGDERPELISLAEDEVIIWSFEDGALRKADALPAGANVAAVWAADVDGNGRNDVIAALPDDPAPVRLWLGEEEEVDHGLEARATVLGPQRRFDMPPIVEIETIQLPGEGKARLAVIERPSKRIAIYEVVREPVEDVGDRDAAMQTFSFADADVRARRVAVADIDGDGLADLLTPDTEASAAVLFRHAPGKGLQRGENHPSLAEITGIAAANVDDDPASEVFVLSEEESVIGRSEIVDGAIGFPVPVTLPSGQTPVAMSVVDVDGAPVLAAVLKDARDYSLALVQMDGATETISLGAASRSPDSVAGLDANQDGRTDLILLTRDKPMTMIERTDDGFMVRESKDMGQFGLVQAATSANTTVYDIDGDEREELLIADRNFVRAVRYDTAPPQGVSPGWQVVAQINTTDSGAELNAVTVSGDRIVACDKGNSRLLFFERDAESSSGWAQRDAVRIAGIAPVEIHAGEFAGDGVESILAVAADGFAVIQLSGERVALRERNAWRTEVERRMQHELTAGDVNQDGFMDMVSLDAGEQMLEIFSFSEAENLLYAGGFQVFESRLFTGGDARQFEPSQVLIGDLTGDGANDLIMVAHDRVLLYPQMTAGADTTEGGN